MIRNFFEWILNTDDSNELSSVKKHNNIEKNLNPVETISHDVIAIFTGITELNKKSDYILSLQSPKAVRKIIREVADLSCLNAVLNHPEISDGLRKEVQKRVDELSGAKNITGAMRAFKRLESQIESADTLLHSEHWSTAFDSLNKLDEDWEIFEHTIESLPDFDQLQKRYANLKTLVKEKINEQEIASQNQSVWDANCFELEKLLAQAHELPLQTIEERLVAIREKQNTLPKISPAVFERYTKRFESALESIRAYICKHEELLEKQKDLVIEAEKIIDRLNEISKFESLPNLTQVTSLSHSFEETIKSLKGADAALRSKFKSAYDACFSRIDEANAIEKEKRAERTKDIQHCFSELEELASVQLSRDNIKEQIEKFEKVTEKLTQLSLTKKDELFAGIKNFEKDFLDAKRTFFAAENEERWVNYAMKVKVTEKAEDYLKWLDDSSLFSEIIGMHKALWEEWKTFGPTPSQFKDELWNRFNTAMQGISQWIDKKRSQEDAQRQNHLIEKIKIVEMLESLVNTGFSQVKGAQKQFNEIFEKWKGIGPVPAADREALNERFKTLIDTFNAQRNVYFDDVRSQFEKSKEVKERLIEQAEKLVDISWREGTQLIQDMRSEWKNAGFSGKNDEENLWKRFNTPIQDFYSRAASTENENLKLKKEVCSKIRACAEVGDEEFNVRKLDEMVHAAFESWRNTGPVPSADLENLMAEFKEVTEAWNARRNVVVSRLNAAREDNQHAKENIIAQVESVLAQELPPSEIAEKLKTLQHEFKQVGYSFKECDEALSKRMQELCNGFFENRRAAYDAVMSERIANLDKKRLICVKLERLASLSSRTETSHAPIELSMDAIAKELEFILAFNTTASQPQSREDMISEAKSLQAQWYEIGPVPREEHQAIMARYTAACDAIFGPRKSPAKRSATTPAPSNPVATETLSSKKDAESQE